MVVLRWGFWPEGSGMSWWRWWLGHNVVVEEVFPWFTNKNMWVRRILEVRKDIWASYIILKEKIKWNKVKIKAMGPWA